MQRTLRKGRHEGLERSTEHLEFHRRDPKSRSWAAHSLWVQALCQYSRALWLSAPHSWWWSCWRTVWVILLLFHQPRSVREIHNGCAGIEPWCFTGVNTWEYICEAYPIQTHLTQTDTTYRWSIAPNTTNKSEQDHGGWQVHLLLKCSVWSLQWALNYIPARESSSSPV